MIEDQLAHAPSELARYVEADGHRAENVTVLGQIPGPGVTFFALGFTVDGSEQLLGVAGGYIGDTLNLTGHTYTEYQRVTENFGEDATNLIGIRDRQLMSTDIVAEGREVATESVTIVLTTGTIDPQIEGVEIVERSIKIPKLKAMAERAYLWPDAVAEVARHTGHIVVRSSGGDPLERAINHARATAAIAQSEKVVAILANETVYEPAFYREVVAGSNPPVLAMVNLGLAQEKGVLYGFTRGLADFGKDEFLLTGSDTAELQHTLLELASHVIVTGAILSGDVTLSSGKVLHLEREGSGPSAQLRGDL